MALVDNTTWCGKDAMEWYSTAILTGGSKETFRRLVNAKSTINVPSMDLGNILQAADCTFSASGNTTIDQNTINLCTIKINQEFCVSDFEGNFLSEQLKAGSNEAQIPTSFSDYFLKLVGDRVSQQTELIAWQGNPSASPVPTNGTQLCEGLVAKMLADATVVDVSGTTLSASNIMAELAKVYAAIPLTVLNGGNVKIYLSIAAARFYKQALVAAFPALITTNMGNFDLKYIDIELVVAPGMATNVMVAADPNSLWLATDLIEDFGDIKIINMYESTGVPTIRFVGRFKIGFGYAVGAEIVLYS